jgi:cbb3-type cytochrome oxidase subunit 3
MDFTYAAFIQLRVTILILVFIICLCLCLITLFWEQKAQIIVSSRRSIIKSQRIAQGCGRVSDSAGKQAKIQLEVVQIPVVMLSSTHH